MDRNTTTVALMKMLEQFPIDVYEYLATSKSIKLSHTQLNGTIRTLAIIQTVSYNRVHSSRPRVSLMFLTD